MDSTKEYDYEQIAKSKNIQFKNKGNQHKLSQNAEKLKILEDKMNNIEVNTYLNRRC